jgi:hypothetical protein
MRESRQLRGIIAALMLPFLPAFADDLITNVMSPVVSYQYYDSVGEDTNATVVSPIVSYQYFDWAGNDVLNLQSSPVVSYDYPFLDTPPLTIFPTIRTPTASEITPKIILPPPTSAQLEIFANGAFATNVALNPNMMTIVLTHGWIPLKPVIGSPLFTPNGVQDWPTRMAAQLCAQGVVANIVAWDWSAVARSSVDDPGTPEAQTGDQGRALGSALLFALQFNYSQKIHFIGHSLGTLVNASAANYLHGDRWANEDVSLVTWPATNTQMTLFDEAEVARGITSFGADIDTLEGRNGNPFLPTTSSSHHPLPMHFAWADNYIAAVGLLQPGAANVILTNEFPASAPDPISWFGEFGTFHGYPQDWYSETIQTDVSALGFLWSFERGGWFLQAPRAGSVYVQAFNDSQWNLTATNWTYGTNLLAARFQEYRSGLVNSISNQVPGLVTANGSVNGQIVDALPSVYAFILSFLTTHTSTFPGSLVHPLGGPVPNGGSSGANVPAYAWMPLQVPVNAVSMSFDYKIQGDWQSDLLAAAFNGTNVLSLPGSQIETNILFSSGLIDVSAFAGQTNEFFIGIVGGTSTNAQLTVENLAFSISSPPLLQAQAAGNNFVLSWPLSAADYILQTSTNLTDTNSWTTVTNVPAIVNLQNTITNPISGGAQFYRLKK